jgi:hypothetical protein
MNTCPSLQIIRQRAFVISSTEMNLDLHGQGLFA